jgi:hypothetical protein
MALELFFTQDYLSARSTLMSFGLQDDEGVIHTTSEPKNPDDKRIS